MIVSRCAAVFLILCFLASPVYALPAVFPACDSKELNVGTSPATRYAYDALNRPTEVSSGSDPNFSGGQTPSGFSVLSSFPYDGEGKRIAATESGVTTTYLYDGLLPIPERAYGSTTATNTWGLSFGGGIGGLLARTTSTGTLYPLYDGSGNVLAWTDSTGQVVSATSYTAFGEVISSSLRSASGGEAISFGFSTKPFSPTTGLSYFGARYYSPALGRWMTPDPLGQLDGPNVYSYVGNNPLNLIDPFGLWYFDLNVTVRRRVPGTKFNAQTYGFMVNQRGVYPYAGGGYASSSGGALTASLSDPTTGWNVGIQRGWQLGRFPLGGQIGYSPPGGLSTKYLEAGLVSPGWSVTGFYVWEATWQEIGQWVQDFFGWGKKGDKKK